MKTVHRCVIPLALITLLSGCSSHPAEPPVSSKDLAADSAGKVTHRGQEGDTIVVARRFSQKGPNVCTTVTLAMDYAAFDFKATDWNVHGPKRTSPAVPFGTTAVDPGGWVQDVCFPDQGEGTYTVFYRPAEFGGQQARWRFQL